MKKIMLADILNSLETGVFEIEVPDLIAKKARIALEKMLELAE